MSYIKQNLDNSDFRIAAINSAIQSQNYEEAAALCLDGEIADASSLRLVHQYKLLKFAAYEGKDTASQKALATEFALDGSFEYFLKLKTLYEENEWRDELRNILDTLERGKPTRHTRRHSCV